MHHTVGTVNTLLTILINHQHLDSIDLILRYYDIIDLWNNFDVPLELLKVTLPIRTKLKERHIFYDHLMDKVAYERGKDNAKELLKGLQ